MSCTIRSVDDLAQLPDDELLACLAALRTAIHEAKRQHAAAFREHQPADRPAFSLHSFDWRPRGAQRLDMPAQLSPETPIDEIPVRASARDALKNLSIFCIDDLSAISEQELLQEEAIGAKTIGRLREFLGRVGLDFLPDPDGADRAQSQQRIVATLPPNARPLGHECQEDDLQTRATQVADVRELLREQACGTRDANESMDWMGIYAYPSKLPKLQPGDTGIFVCPPAWRGRLATVCAIWIKGHTDWAARLPPGTPWKRVFWTEAHPDGLQLVRALLPDQAPNSPARTYRFAPSMAASSLPDPGSPKLDQIVSLWREPANPVAQRAAGARVLSVAR
jgi:hypothetical protein